MSEAEVIKKTGAKPITIDSLERDLLALGVETGMTLIVHSALSSLGWVCGGPVAVILALEEVMGPEGTLVMPSHSSDLSDPQDWNNPPVPEDWKEIIRQTLPVYDPDLTPTRGMGRIAETFRKQPGVKRSSHPQSSFAAWGKQAAFITGEHSLEYSLGEDSPLARLYDLGAWILLLGVTHENNTSLHLAEFRAEYPGKKVIKQGAPVLMGGSRKWVEFSELEDHSEDFNTVGEAYRLAGGRQFAGRIGAAESLLIPQRDLVDFAAAWMSEHRDLSLKEKGE